MRAPSSEQAALGSRVANLDCAAHTPLDPRVEAVMTAAYRLAGNPHNRAHPLGERAHEAVEHARSQVARAIGARPEQTIFTSGATEANNLALLGAPSTASGGRHIITCVTEHASGLGPIAALDAAGWRVTRLEVDEEGRIALDELERAIGPQTALISLMWVNNELGTVHDVEAVGEIARRHGVRFHCDAAQAVGRLVIDVDRAGVTSLSLSAHKAHGPSGVGALFVRDPKALRPTYHGGGQERGLRPGTTPTALVAGMGRACELAISELEHTRERVAEQCGRLRAGLSRIEGVRVLGAPADDRSGILSVLVPGVADDDLLAMVGDRVAIARGSACHGDGDTPSHVISAIGLSPTDRRSVVRLSVSRQTDRWEVEQALDALTTSVRWLRRAGTGRENRIQTPDRPSRRRQIP